MADNNNSSNNNNNGGSSPDGSSPTSTLLPPQTIVKITGITARPELNNQYGTIHSYNTDRQRYTVTITNTSTNTTNTMLFKPENVLKATLTEQAQHKALEIKNNLTMLYNDPQTKEFLRRAYTSIDTRLPPQVKPEHVVGAIGFTVLILVFMIGFVKTMLLCSVLVLLPTVSLPDIQANKSVREIAQNFPNRWRENLSQMLGGRVISDRMNYASLIVMALLVGNVLFASSNAPSSRRPPTPPPTLPPVQPYAAEPPSTAIPSTSIEQTLEQYYKLGYQDATDKKEYGTSLPPEPPTTLSSSSSYSSSSLPPRPPPSIDDLDYSYPPPPPPTTKKSKFNFSTIMAIFTLLRTGRELALRPDGGYDVDLFVANAKNMEPWKMGLVGICLYRVITTLF